MKLPKGTIDKFFLEQYIVENWDTILSLLDFNNNLLESEMDSQIYEELKKYKLSEATLVEVEKLENEEE